MSFSAVIVKGNPRYIKQQAVLADPFYAELEKRLRDSGFEVAYDPGEPYTMPPPADLWVGHSRGADRFRFAPPEQLVLRIGASHPEALNHPDDMGLAGPLGLQQRPDGWLPEPDQDPGHYMVPPQFDERLRDIRRELVMRKWRRLREERLKQ